MDVPFAEQYHVMRSLITARPCLFSSTVPLQFTEKELLKSMVITYNREQKTEKNRLSMKQARMLVNEYTLTEDVLLKSMTGILRVPKGVHGGVTLT